MTDEFTPPTYEEYLKATNFARLRYKWGLAITIIAWLSIILLIGFVVYYGNELKTTPTEYVAKKLDAECFCRASNGITYFFNETETTYKIENNYAKLN